MQQWAAPDKDFILRHIQQQPHYSRFARAIYPSRVYLDPVYPQQAVIVELPFSVPFRCETVFWTASRLTHRLPVYRPDRLEFFAVLSPADTTGKPYFQILFAGEEVFQIYHRWIYCIDRKGTNLLKAYYQKTPRPQHAPGSYEARCLNYDHGAIYADHDHLRKILQGITVD
jgi:hypothetical protein